MSTSLVIKVCLWLLFVLNNTPSDINKRNNHLTSQFIEHKKTKIFDIIFLGPVQGQSLKCDDFKPVIGVQLSPLDNWISTSISMQPNDEKRWKTYTDSLLLKKTIYYNLILQPIISNLKYFFSHLLSVMITSFKSYKEIHLWPNQKLLCAQCW